MNPPRHQIVVDGETWERQASYILERIDRVSDDVLTMKSTMQNAVSAGVQDGLKALAQDAEFGERFWRRGFESMSKHAGDAGSKWIGSRILTALVIAVVSAGITWLVKQGKI